MCLDVRRGSVERWSLMSCSYVASAGPASRARKATSALCPCRRHGEPLLLLLLLAGMWHRGAVTTLFPATSPQAAPASSSGYVDTVPALSPLYQAAMDALEQLRSQSWPDRVTSEEGAILLAEAASLPADCSRRLVGCAVISIDGRVLSTGRNGAPSGYPGCLTAGACPRGQMTKEQIKPGAPYRAGTVKCHALHAEKNGLLFSDPVARRGGYMAVTDAPCDDCSLDLAGSGLARVIWPARLDDGTRVIRRLALGHGAPIGGHYAA